MWLWVQRYGPYTQCIKHHSPEVGTLICTFFRSGCSSNLPEDPQLVWGWLMGLRPHVGPTLLISSFLPMAQGAHHWRSQAHHSCLYSHTLCHTAGCRGYRAHLSTGTHQARTWPQLGKTEQHWFFLRSREDGRTYTSEAEISQRPNRKEPAALGLWDSLSTQELQTWQNTQIPFHHDKTYGAPSTSSRQWLIHLTCFF